MAERKYSAWAPDGTEHKYVTALDARQACELTANHEDGPYTLYPPGSKPEPDDLVRLDYATMSSESIRKMCVQRNIRGYLTMDRDAQILALRTRDVQDAEAVSTRTEGMPVESEQRPAETQARKPRRAKKPEPEPKPKPKPKPKPESAPEPATAEITE